MSVHLSPVPRLARWDAARASLTARWRIACPADDAAARRGAEECRSRVRERCGLELPMQPAGRAPAITLRIAPEAMDRAALRAAGWTGVGAPAEAYQLTCGEVITLIGSDEAGLYYGVQTLAQVLDRDGGYPLGAVTDYPALPLRGFQFDLGRQVERMEYALAVCRRMSRLKANTVFLYCENGIRYDRHPGFAAPGAWTMAETKAFIRQCASWHMDVIPIVPNLGHTHFIVRHPDYAHLNEGREGARDSYGGAGNSLCPALPETRRLVEAMFAEWFAISPSPYFHISCDECHQLGLCSLCRPKYDAGGMAEVYLAHVNWAAELAVQAGKRPMLWGDQLLYWPERLPALHPALIVMDWEYHTRNGRSLNAFPHWRAEDTTGIFLRAGHEVVLAPYGASSHTAQFLNAYGRQPGVLGVNSTVWELSRTFFECEGTGIEFAVAGAWQGFAPEQDTFVASRARQRFGVAGDAPASLVDLRDGRYRGMVSGELFSYVDPLPKDALSRAPELTRRLRLTERFAAAAACAEERERLACEAHLLARERFAQRLRETMSAWYQALRHPLRTPPTATAARLRDLLRDVRALRETEAMLWARYRPAEQTSPTLRALERLEAEMTAFLAHHDAGEPTGLERDVLVLHLIEPDPCFRRMAIEATDADGGWQTLYRGHDGGNAPLRMNIFSLPAGVPMECTVRVTLQPHGELGVRFLEILYADGRRAAPVAAVSWTALLAAMV
ncbi:MAG TPA: glycoside hydrolase family 20 zincin-like fold domain-containing protein, partial [Armatimonadota bacterium]|nr:glycoside hydrolase family 20 zincin-like fold domain-containing protein [Armatimonadota bacterium]